MIKRLLKNKTGVTILEGLIALGLLALVAGGTFGVLLSVSRKSSQPDIREEMLLAVERANEQLQAYARFDDDARSQADDIFQNGLCGYSGAVPTITDSAPLNSGEHDISCLLPAICDPDLSGFRYNVTTGSSINPSGFPTASDYRAVAFVAPTKITFNIKCNGFTL